jgi:hypothetical protein
MLACLVHKDCKDISMRPLDLPPGRTSIQAKIQTLRENADVFIEMNGQQAYNKMLAGLVTRMTRMGEEDVREMNTPVHETNTPVSALEQLADDSIEGNDE